MKDKKNINLFIKDKILKLLDVFYIPGLIVNFIHITKL